MPENPYRNVGERLKRWVERNYESVAAFGRATGKNSQFWYQYFNGSRRPGPDTQNLLRKVGCDVEYIMTGNDGGGGQSAVHEQSKKYGSGVEISQLKNKIDKLQKENSAFRDALAPAIVKMILKKTKKTRK